MHRHRNRGGQGPPYFILETLLLFIHAAQITSLQCILRKNGTASTPMEMILSKLIYSVCFLESDIDLFALKIIVEVSHDLWRWIMVDCRNTH